MTINDEETRDMHTVNDLAKNSDCCYFQNKRNKGNDYKSIGYLG